MKVQNITAIPNFTIFCKAEKQLEHENIHVHENVEKNKTRKSVHGTRMPPPIVFISPAIKHLRKNYKKINQQGT